LSGDDSRPWRIEHPLQPYAAGYYDSSDPALFSFARAYAERKARLDAALPFVDWRQQYGEIIESGETSLDWLKRFWRDPAKTQLRDEAGLGLDALSDDESLDREPLEARADRRERIESQLLFDALAAGRSALPQAAPDWLARSGRLAIGAIGASAYAHTRSLAQPVLEAVRAGLGDGARREAQAVEVNCEGVRLAGTVREVFRCADGTLQLFGARIGGLAQFAHLLPFYVDWACLRMAGVPMSGAYFVENDGKSANPRVPEWLEAVCAQSDAQLRAGLSALLRMALASRRRPLVFPPRTAWAWVHADAENREEKARAVWESGEYSHGERDYAPGYAALLVRGADLFDPATPAARAFAETCARIVDILNLRGNAGAGHA
jgi:exodeoxyribonuclease V gamma subunit